MRRRDVLRRRRTEQAQAELDLLLEDLEDLGDALLAAAREAPEDRAADEDRLRAEEPDPSAGVDDPEGQEVRA